MDLKYDIKYIEEKDFLGTAGSISYLRFYDITKPFFVANCDVLLNIDFSEVLEYHLKENADITIISSKENIDVAYGVIRFDEKNNFLQIDEKPNYEFFVNTGIYVLNPEIVNLIGLEEKLDMPELLKRARATDKTIKVYQSRSKMTDIGQWEYYKKFLQLKHEKYENNLQLKNRKQVNKQIMEFPIQNKIYKMLNYIANNKEFIKAFEGVEIYGIYSVNN